MSDKYILKGHEAVPADLMEWAQWFETADRTVAKAQLPGDVSVSTVFLGLNHDFLGDGPPILFETMIFGGPLDLEEARYATWDEAEEGHAAMVKRAEEAKP